MLNVNAKAFVPQSFGEHAGAHTNAIYRYHITLPMERVCDVIEPPTVSNGILMLLGRRWLCSSSQGGLGEEPLQMFITTLFDAVENATQTGRNPNAPTGMLLSRSILSLSGVVSAINTVNDAPGFLIRVDVSTDYKAEVASQLRAAWDDFFGIFRGELQVSALGYVESSCGTSTKKTYGGTYRHYFFLSCPSLHSQPEELTIQRMMGCPFPKLRVVQVNAIVPFVCNPRIPIGVVISLGDTAKEKLLSEGKPDKTFSISFYPYDVSQTMSSLDEYEEQFLSFLKEENCKWDRTSIIHVEVKIFKSFSIGISPIPIWDMVQFVGNICEDTASSVLGVCCSEDTLEGIQLARHKEEGNVCYLNATLQSVLNEGRSLDMSNTYFGRVPQYIKGPIKSNQYEFVRKQMDKWLPVYDEPTLLNRMVFASAADKFSKEKYYVRNQVIGEKILVVTNPQGDVFGADLKTGSVFALPNCFGGAVGPVKDSVFQAVIAPSFRGYLECVIVVEDVLCFEGIMVSELPFPERWHYVEKTILDDQTSRPHINTDHVVIVRTLYSPFDRTEQVLKNPPLEHPTLGLVFVPHSSNDGKMKIPSYSWVPPESITARFIAGNVEEIPDTNGEIKRVWLHVKDEYGEIVPYNDEYTDYLLDAFQFLNNGSIIECMLRRSDDGSHWWELLKDHNTGNEKPTYTYEYVEKLVHAPGLTHEEMLWLLKASTFKCGRCQTLSDIGRTNPRYQTYWCQSCWKESGHGDCVYCGRSCVIGKIDGVSERFYCDTCWGVFSTTNTNAEIGYLVPPPPNASFTTQVLTRCVSLMIDAINPKVPTNDVLEICCGGSVIRKWIKNKTTRYVGFDLKSSVVEATLELISSLRDEMPDMSSYDVICADAFSTDLWTQHITKIHPRQFHAITGFTGLHYAFDTEEKARHVVGSISNALVPRGVFFGCYLDASTFYGKGEISNELFTVEWDDDFLPRIGHCFLFSIEDGPKKKINVVTSDFLVAVAQEYRLSVIPEVCLTFREILENDPNFTRVLSKSEKEYVCAMRMFAFRKDCDPQAPASSKTDGGSDES
ncbi:hypothetical protein DQ04_05491010 [Trypanosoma grayi]|uniref:hypothetical protein n=1 Tax=Trypanosoma grayi TaxID=71804 RepID=UPI0004F3FD9B|nr:hypothetical protein DQ04_05491010 [Trypanosoma grayi]KEG09276.1 hypothetical protein DQ04_05491010 [Trypanosoma grayi]